MLQEPTVETGGTAVLDATDAPTAMQKLDDLLDLRLFSGASSITSRISGCGEKRMRRR